MLHPKPKVCRDPRRSVRCSALQEENALAVLLNQWMPVFSVHPEALDIDLDNLILQLGVALENILHAKLANVIGKTVFENVAIGL